MTTTYKTLDEARTGASQAVAIIEIDHATEGRCFIGCRASINVMRRALADRPMPEIVRLIASHTTRTPENIKADRQHDLKTNTRCDRCSTKVDGTTCYHQRETGNLAGSAVPVTAYYCSGCETMLKAVGHGEQTEMENRTT